MIKQIIISLTIVSLALPMAYSQNNVPTKEVQKEAMIPDRAMHSKALDTDTNTLRKRADTELNRHSRGYDLNEKQKAEAAKIFLAAEKEMNDLRAKMNEINKKKLADFEALLTPTQKADKQAADSAKVKKFQDAKASKDAVAPAEIKTREPKK
ncbi:MAG: hypothetical protein LBO69_08370 [Ignavibacteria bacterium]|jgi:hypothetical protein|nr:hypothetical protein [Ignavibacteria bacterium]